ncbi:hypothetical protein CJA_0193 [Cellvibrio japonicus Ueda107]|uniref:Uncharacterized protein n=1 Tax=Cellvibrio japonicus (strain Ueda107) TaxID=498211 RepID=B3PGD8_CELJU|nr:hypothetical protein CJA_0193 [Cellvibrio japonicus Ueda107]
MQGAIFQLAYLKLFYNGLAICAQAGKEFDNLKGLRHGVHLGFKKAVAL